MPTISEVENGVTICYWSCPAKLIPHSVIYWDEMYDYEQEFKPEVPDFRRRPRRFLLMWSYYKSKHAEYAKEKQRRDNI